VGQLFPLFCKNLVGNISAGLLESRWAKRVWNHFFIRLRRMLLA
jgi:hypothetical protein